MMRGLIGYPLGHSYSKTIHELMVDYPYQMFSLNDTQFMEFMQAKNFQGINVTIPYKRSVLPYLDEADETVKEVGACNCIVNKDNRLIGYNTDVFGFTWMIKNHGFNVEGMNVAVLGSGGASKAVKKALSDLKAKVLIVSRTKSPETITYEELNDMADTIDGIVNTTPVGMYPHNDELILNLHPFKNLKMVVDIIANPLRTKLLFEAKKLNIPCVGGLEMLVAQAYKADEIFENKKLDESLINQTLKAIKATKQNIVLIGMPGSGKSTIGQKLSEVTNKELLEMDTMIEADIKMPIKDYFEKYGEEAFRKREKDLVKYSRTNTNCIISTGGGVVKDEENMCILQENGIIVYLKRDNLVPTDSRPLSSNQEDLDKLYQERKSLYEHYADIVVDNNDNIDKTVQKILEEIGE